MNSQNTASTSFQSDKLEYHYAKHKKTTESECEWKCELREIGTEKWRHSNSTSVLKQNPSQSQLLCKTWRAAVFF